MCVVQRCPDEHTAPLLLAKTVLFWAIASVRRSNYWQYRFLPTPPNTQQSLSGRYCWLGESLWQLTALPPPPYSFDIATRKVSDRLFIIPQHPLQILLQIADCKNDGLLFTRPNIILLLVLAYFFYLIRCMSLPNNSVNTSLNYIPHWIWIFVCIEDSHESLLLSAEAIKQCLQWVFNCINHYCLTWFHKTATTATTTITFSLLKYMLGP